MADELEISNEELFTSALNDLPEPEVVAEDTRARDEQGRFVEKTEPEAPEVAETQAKPAEPKEEPQESPGVRQLREALERANRRADDMERRFTASQPKPEAPAKPDIFENPDGAIKAGVQEALTPIERQFASFIETVSRKDAIREHGEDRVTQAFGALDQAAKSGDPQALAVVQAVKQSMDPFGDIVNWHVKNEAAINPDGFFQRKLEEALKDEKFKGELMNRLQPAQTETAKPVFKVPPNLNRAATAAPALEEGGDLSNESLFSAALR